MSCMFTITIVYNSLIGVCLIGSILAVRTTRRPATALATAVAGVAAVVVLAALLGEDGFGRLRLLAYGTFVHGTVFLIAIGLLGLREFRWAARTCIGLGILTAAVGVHAFFIEPHWLEVTRYRIVTHKLAQPVRIAVISDLQTDMIGEYERGVIRSALVERPDLILLPGDYVQHADAVSYGQLVIELRSLLLELGFGAPLGVFAVKGNVDHPGWSAIFAQLRVHCFERTEEVHTGPLKITGLSLSNSQALHHSISRKDHFHIVFGHYPDFALGDIEADLLVAGHTHGGQVQLPGFGPPITLSNVPRHWAAGGMFDLGKKGTLIISRGIGMERNSAPRLRFLCRPQLVLIDIVPE